MQAYYWWRVTKYNPFYRHAEGYYTKEEWTSFYDIGNYFYDGQLTTTDYQRIENAYIEAVIQFMKCEDINYLIIHSLEKSKLVKKLNMPKELVSFYELIKNDSYIYTSKIPQLMQLVLREYLWCKLKYPRRMQVHFGWDYYMYIGASKLCAETVHRIEENGLFVEPFVSPYL